VPIFLLDKNNNKKIKRKKYIRKGPRYVILDLRDREADMWARENYKEKKNL
jgi:hypothetical protein